MKISDQFIFIPSSTLSFLTDRIKSKAFEESSLSFFKLWDLTPPWKLYLHRGWITPGQLLLSPLLLPVFWFEDEWLTGQGRGQGGDGGRGQRQQQRGPRPQHADRLHLRQPPRPRHVAARVRVRGGVERGAVLGRRRKEVLQRLRAAHLQRPVGVRMRGGRGGGHVTCGGVAHVVAEGGERLLGGGARPLADHGLKLQLALLAGVCAGARHCPHTTPPGSGTKIIFRY